MEAALGLTALEKKFSLQCRAAEISGARLLVGLSGGADSVALLRLLTRVQSGLRLQLVAAHVHHGEVESPGGPISEAGRVQREFRDRAASFCLDLCQRWGVEFVSNSEFGNRIGAGPAQILTSEQELREYRHTWLRQWCAERDCQFIALAHHHDDLLETRLIRLIRGVGSDGLATMRVVRGQLFRPLLGESRADLEAYLKTQDVSWLEDPSNQQWGPLRNWLRHRWLPELEKKRPGSTACMAASLERIAQALAAIDEDSDQGWGKNGIERARWLALGQTPRRQLLARYLRSLGVRNFTQGQLDEVLKRLESPRRELTFRVAGVDWRVDTAQIWVEPAAPF